MSGSIKYHTDLRVWQSSRVLARATYGIARFLPKEERWVLADQMKRAAISVPANIAEGRGRGTTQELIRFLRVARGSLAELHSHFTLACDLGYSNLSLDHPIFSEVAEVNRMLNALISSLLNKSAPTGKGSLAKDA